MNRNNVPSSRGRGTKTSTRGNNRFNPYNRRGGGGWNNHRNNSGPRERSVAISIPSFSGDRPVVDTSTSSITTSVCPPNAQPLVSFIMDKSPGRYPGWKLYFPLEVYTAESSVAIKTKAMEGHIDRKRSVYDFQKVRQYLWFSVVLQSLQKDELFISGWPNFSQDLVEQPSETLGCLGLAMHQTIIRLPEQPPLTQQLTQTASPNLHLQAVRARIEGCGPLLNIRSLKVSSYGRLVTVRGTIIRASAAELLCSWMAFSCGTCNTQQAIRQPDGIMTAPSSCQNGCRRRTGFVPLLWSPYTRTEPFQTIRLQESMQGAQFDSGRVPRNIEVEFANDLVDSVCPGDDVTVTGILKVHPQDENQQRKGQASMYKIYMEAVTVASNKNVMTTRKSDFTEKDRQAIAMIAAEPCPFRLLVHSLCPNIYGHEMVKAGLVLGLFGGASNAIGRRAESHVLVVGDPGLGKSQMLQACANVSPRGVFVCGKSTTNAGLTVSVRHEKGSSGGTLEAGALVLADQGACCIDEFDKMSSNHQALLEVMEQQTVSVAKAGVLCSLPARTCVLAAANPTGGHYNREKSVAENLRINPALLSRFDLVFILLDRPDAHTDRLLTAHIQALHANNHNTSTTSKYSANASSASVRDDSASSSMRTLDDTRPLYVRLRLATDEQMDMLPHELMQKYIGYARKTVQPKLSTEAAVELKRFYLDLRKQHHGVESIPVTTRQLEALIRLTQARARAELAAEATLQHAQDVLSIVRQSMADVLSTDHGTLEMARSITGSGMSQATLVKKLLRVLQCKSCDLGKTVFSTDELKEMGQTVGVTSNISSLIDSLNIQGFLLKKGQNLYKFLND